MRKFAEILVVIVAALTVFDPFISTGVLHVIGNLVSETKPISTSSMEITVERTGRSINFLSIKKICSVSLLMGFGHFQGKRLPVSTNAEKNQVQLAIIKWCCVTRNGIN